MPYVVDTHALIWYMEASPRLSDGARVVLHDESSHLIIPTIVLAEARYLCARGRVSVVWEDLLTTVLQDHRCSVAPLTVEIVERLPSDLSIHDGVICATALFYKKDNGEDVKLITRDAEIVRSGLVETVW